MTEVREDTEASAARIRRARLGDHIDVKSWVVASVAVRMGSSFV